jgi:hypothetical protein
MSCPSSTAWSWRSRWSNAFSSWDQGQWMVAVGEKKGETKSGKSMEKLI